MDSTNTKVAAYVLVVLAVVALLGLALLKFKQSAEAPVEVNQMTQEQRVDVLQKTTGTKSPHMKNFIQNEKARLGATREAEEAVSGH